MNESADPGQTAYDAYTVATGGKTWDGRDMPTWDQLGDRIRDAWTDAGRAVLEAYGVNS